MRVYAQLDKPMLPTQGERADTFSLLASGMPSVQASRAVTDTSHDFSALVDA